ncbi:hypothetical protein Tco_0616243 [Tanacetum coccineum]
MEICTKLSKRVLDLETTKTVQAKEIANLKKRVKKLKRKRKSRTPKMNLFKIGTSRRRSLGEEDASKQGRNLKQGKHRSIFKESDFDDEGFDADMDEVFKDVKGDAEQVISAAADEVPTSDAVNTASIGANTTSAPVTTDGVSVSTAGENITTAEPSTPLTTTNIPDEEDLTIAQTLVKMRSEKSKERGVVMKEPSESATRPTVPPQQHDPKYKGRATKSPIVNWKTQILGEEISYQIKRADRSYKMYKIFSEMLNDFDRQDLIDLYRLVTKRFKTTRPEGSDRLLWGDLMTIFEPSKEDELWRNQQDYTLISWELYDSCGVHSLLMDTMHIHMLVERTYPLTQLKLERMINGRLQIDHEFEMAYKLIRFIKSQYKK